MYFNATYEVWTWYQFDWLHIVPHHLVNHYMLVCKTSRSHTSPHIPWRKILKVEGLLASLSAIWVLYKNLLLKYFLFFLVSYSHKMIVWHEMLSYSSRLLGQTLMFNMEGKNAIRRSALDAFVNAARSVMFYIWQIIITMFQHFKIFNFIYVS